MAWKVENLKKARLSDKITIAH